MAKDNRNDKKGRQDRPNVQASPARENQNQSNNQNSNQNQSRNSK